MEKIYNIIKELRPHFFSLREIKDTVSLDIKLPVKWRYENMLDPKELTFEIKIQDEKPTNRLISLISTATSDGYDFVFKYADTIIRVNKEEEEKERLFNEKVQELKTLFLSSPLDKLKEINFKEDELSTEKSKGEIRLGSGEGSGEDGEDKTETD